MIYTKPLTKLSRKDVATAGGKGASLGELVRMGVSVPNGFVVLANSFDTFISEAGLQQKIRTQLNKVDRDKTRTVERASKQIQSMILRAKIPQEIIEAITKDFSALGAKYVAIRSSATAEDSSLAAWAGQLDTYLNTIEKTLLENVQKCWASLYTTRAIFYRFEHGLKDTNVSVAVVVQEMIESEKAGVAFSVHPVTQDKNQILIEAGFGLGEVIVSGQITPDNYIIDKQKFKIIDIVVNEQKKGLFEKKGGGNEWRRLGEKGKKQILSKKEIIELSKLIIKIENHYSFPVDIEWTKKKGKFYFTQSRPITTLKKNKETEDNKRVYRKIFNRYLPIYAAEYNYIGKTDTLKEITGGSANFPPLYINIPEKGNDVYYDDELYEISSRKAFEYFKRNPKKMKKISDDYRQICEANFDFIKHAQVKDIKKLFDIDAKYMSPMMTILILVGREEFDKEMKQVATIAKKIRYWNDKILYDVGIKIFDLICQKFSWPQNDDRADFITIKEALATRPPTIKEINKRKKSWVLLEGKKLYTGKNIEGFLRRNNIILKKEERIKNLVSIKEIRGNVAQKGIVKGKVKIVFTINDVFKVKSGEIIVSPMTGPDFILAIKKSSAMITDEGGITSHAAIISRELKIPCIIGTRIATQILKDGDLVEVDADNGVVRILEKIKN